MRVSVDSRSRRPVPLMALWRVDRSGPPLLASSLELMRNCAVRLRTKWSSRAGPLSATESWLLLMSSTPEINHIQPKSSMAVDKIA